MRTLNDYFVTAEIEDISTASTFVAIPDGGRVIKIILHYKVLLVVVMLRFLLKLVVLLLLVVVLQLLTQVQQQVM